MGVGPDFTVVTPSEHQIDYIHRRTESEEIYFVVNSADAPVDAECTFRVAEGAQPFLWNAEDGSVRPCPLYRAEAGSIRVPLRLPAVSSVFVVFQSTTGDDPVVALRRSGQASTGLLDRDLEVLRRTSNGARIRVRRGGSFELTTAGGRSGTVEIADPPGDFVLDGPWTLEFPDGQGAPSSLRLDKLVSWPRLEDEAARTFSGTARYRTTFDVLDESLGEGQLLHLDLGEVAEVAEVLVNGKSLGILWNAPFRVDVTRWLKAGANKLEVKVTNLWHNRIVGDLRFPDAGIHARTNLKHKFRADMELLPSGLLGPVVLGAEVEVDVPLR
jgi:hypothetical protein